jgi:crossover junction endodeoxyribonuclease RuvC
VTAAGELGLPPLTPPGGRAVRIIGVDTSLASTGISTIRWAPNETEPITATAEVITTKGKRADTVLARDARIGLITQSVRQYLAPDVCLVVIESGAFASVGGSNWDRAGLWWRVVHAVHGYGLDAIPLATVPPATLKKWATDRGNADKSDVAVAMARLWPNVDAPANDAWDALGLAHMGAQVLGWPVPSRAHHAAARAKGVWPESVSTAEVSA